jgi:hypothetical protein
MTRHLWTGLGAIPGVALLCVGGPARAANDLSLTLSYGVLAGLTGDPAPSEQG